jgi:hypothetical protein
MIAVVAGACASPVPAPTPALSQPRPPAGTDQPGQGPALGVFPPNATRVTAKVLAQRTYKTESLPADPYVGELPPTLDAVTLEIEDARPARANVAMGPAVGTFEAFSRDRLPAGLAGRRIEATLILAGNTLAHRWFISEIRTLPQ